MDWSGWILKPQVFQALCDIRGTPNIDFFASRVFHQLLCFLETGPIQQGEGCISKVMGTPKGVCFPTFQPDWKSVLKSSNGHDPDLTVNSNLAKSPLVSTSFSDVSKQTDFDSTNRGPFSPKMEKTSINRERKIKILTWKNSRDDLFVEIISKNTVELIASAKRQVYQYTHYQSTWGK